MAAETAALAGEDASRGEAAVLQGSPADPCTRPAAPPNRRPRHTWMQPMPGATRRSCGSSIPWRSRPSARWRRCGGLPGAEGSTNAAGEDQYCGGLSTVSTRSPIGSPSLRAVSKCARTAASAVMPRRCSAGSGEFEAMVWNSSAIGR